MIPFEHLLQTFGESKVRGLAKKTLDPYVVKGEINAAQEVVMEDACVDFLELILTEWMAHQQQNGAKT